MRLRSRDWSGIAELVCAPFILLDLVASTIAALREDYPRAAFHIGWACFMALLVLLFKVDK